MWLIHKDIPHMPITELENDSESVWFKCLQIKLLILWQVGIDHLMKNWKNWKILTVCSENSLIKSGINIKATNLPQYMYYGTSTSVILFGLNRLNKSGSALSQSEGQKLVDIMNDHGLEQLVHFPTRERNTLDLIMTSLPAQFVDIHSPDKLSEHDIVSGTLKFPPIKKTRRKVYRYQKGDYESMRTVTLKFAKEKYFNSYSDTSLGSRKLQSDYLFHSGLCR